MSKRIRDIPIQFRVSASEKAIIEEKMSELGTTNLTAYMLKMAIDGYVFKLELPELKEMISLLRRMSNNLNQITKRANETGRIYETELSDIRQQQEQLWNGLNKLITQFAVLK